MRGSIPPRTACPGRTAVRGLVVVVLMPLLAALLVLLDPAPARGTTCVMPAPGSARALAAGHGALFSGGPTDEPNDRAPGDTGDVALGAAAGVGGVVLVTSLVLARRRRG